MIVGEWAARTAVVHTPTLTHPDRPISEHLWGCMGMCGDNYHSVPKPLISVLYYDRIYNELIQTSSIPPEFYVYVTSMPTTIIIPGILQLQRGCYISYMTSYADVGEPRPSTSGPRTKFITTSACLLRSDV